MDIGLVRNNIKATMSALRAKYGTVVPILLPEKPGCRHCGTVDRAKEPFSVMVLSRGLSDTFAIVAVATFCVTCYDLKEAHDKVLDHAVSLAARMPGGVPR